MFEAFYINFYKDWRTGITIQHFISNSDRYLDLIGPPRNNFGPSHQSGLAGVVMRYSQGQDRLGLSQCHRMHAHICDLIEFQG